jgi:hypothetical protein
MGDINALYPEFEPGETVWRQIYMWLTKLDELEQIRIASISPWIGPRQRRA